MPDALFDDPRFARLYDPLDPDRGDLEVYAAMVREFGAKTVLDVGCGTGTFACMLAESGLEVIGPRWVQHLPGGRGQEAGDDFAERRLAGAGLADDAQHLARAQPEAHLVDRPQLLPVFQRELDHEAVRGKHGPAGART